MKTYHIETEVTVSRVYQITAASEQAARDKVAFAKPDEEYEMGTETITNIEEED